MPKELDNIFKQNAELYKDISEKSAIPAEEALPAAAGAASPNGGASSERLAPYRGPRAKDVDRHWSIFNNRTRSYSVPRLSELSTVTPMGAKLSEPLVQELTLGISQKNCSVIFQSGVTGMNGERCGRGVKYGIITGPYEGYIAPPTLKNDTKIVS